MDQYRDDDSGSIFTLLATTRGGNVTRRKQKLLFHNNASLWLVTLALILGLLAIRAPGPELLNAADKAVLTPVESISHQHHNHIHGIGYDSRNQRLFVATHYGIFIWKDTKLFQLGANRDDFMGFSLNPMNPNVIYTSGHPATGGNLGVMKSEDGGVSFNRIFAGISGETVDFHSMVISPANSNILYGFFQGNLYRSKDGGKKWEIARARGLPVEGSCFGAPCLSADGKSDRTIYAGTLKGLLASNDFGENWSTIQAELGPFAGIGADPANPKRLLGFTKKLGLSLSQDGGRTWHARHRGVKLSSREFIFAFAFDPENSKHLFAATPESVFRSDDGGESWNKIL
jgi:photosystem II stability/assembly factor-like uncharacterized protein